MTARVPVRFTLNRTPVEDLVEPRTSLLDFLREAQQLTGTHAGCEMGSCGACLVMLEGAPVHACLVYAVQVDGQAVETIEGLSESGAIADLQAAFLARNALQCGFCTAGMLVTAQGVLRNNAAPTRLEIRDGLSGNYCRCTGYEAIVDAIAQVAAARAAQPAEDRP